jgi:transcriptional regulator with XRE-family HTH domain
VPATLDGVSDLRFGAKVRAVRVRRRWRQQDLAQRAGVSEATVWRVERGRLEEMTLATIRRVCAPLDIDIDLLARGHGAELDRLVNAKHSALHESVARTLARWAPSWELAPEVSFNIWGERGVIDLLLWHPGRRALLMIELKTELVDHGELISTMDRRARLAREIVAARGWDPVVVASWVIVAPSRTNERRLVSHRAMLRAAFPDDLRRVRAWLADPAAPIRAISTWREPTAAPLAPTLRVRPPKAM